MGGRFNGTRRKLQCPYKMATGKGLLYAKILMEKRLNGDIEMVMERSTL